MDNAGENKLLVDRLNSSEWELYPTVEYTARDTPQQNYLGKMAITVMCNRRRALMVKAHTPNDLRHLVMRKAVETATHLDGLEVVKINGVTATRNQHFTRAGGAADGDVDPNAIAKCLRIWGEAGVIKTHKSMDPKTKDRRITCMMVGYAPSHAPDCY